MNMKPLIILTKMTTQNQPLFHINSVFHTRATDGSVVSIRTSSAIFMFRVFVVARKCFPEV